ncbi:hypothetical protein FB451DRAFT_1021433 [Mycena latifolia]|nr:hypothetical protein FB451DRAFT_1021433 [Mycena latifolia]
MARTGDTGDPWGIPFLTGFSALILPSRHTAASRSVKKDPTHLTRGRGMRLRRISRRSRSWFTLSKKPEMSKVRTEVTNPWFRAASTSSM